MGSVESPAATSGAAPRVADSDVEASERRALDSAKPERARQQTSLWWQQSAGASYVTPPQSSGATRPRSIVYLGQRACAPNQPNLKVGLRRQRAVRAGRRRTRRVASETRQF